jgi:SAM-dependent methyltransferase
MEQNHAVIGRLLAQPCRKLVDLGCHDGARTGVFAAAANAEQVLGVEVDEDAARLAEERGIDVLRADLNQPLPIADAEFDIVVSNQVIEHLGDTDRFVSESFRIVRPGGLVVTSTENLASWHNIIALVAGWQPFSLTNISQTRLGVGNPLAVHRGETPVSTLHAHNRVFAYRGLRELYEAHGFEVECVTGVGYFPLASRVGRWDPRHAAFLTLAARRPRARS